MVSAVDTFDRRLSSKAVAVHEAGHLFASLALAPTVHVAAIWIKRRSAGWEGMVERRRDRAEWEADTPRHMRTEILVKLAGPVAETRWRLRGRWAAIFAGGTNGKIAVGMRREAGEDFGVAVDYLESVGADDLEGRFVAAWIETEKVLHKHWRSIVAVGSLLKAQGRIEAKQLYDLPEVAGLVA